MSLQQPTLPSKTNKEFHDRIVQNREDDLRAFLENPPQGFDINGSIKAAEELTGLSYAVMNEMNGIVHLLLAYGADPNIPDKFNQTALHFATCNGSHELLPDLLAHGARLDVRTREEETPFATADTSNAPTLAILLNAGANPDDASKKGFTNLHSAAIHNEDKAAKQLLEAGADPLALTLEGKPPLHFAEMNHADGPTRLIIADYAKLPRLDAEKNYPMDALLAGEEGKRLIDNPYNWRHGLPEQLSRLADAGEFITKQDWLRPMAGTGGKSMADIALGARQGDALLSLLLAQGEALTGRDLFAGPHATMPTPTAQAMQAFGQLGLLFKREQAIELKPVQLRAAYDLLPAQSQQSINLHSLTHYVSNQQRLFETATGQGR